MRQNRQANFAKNLMVSGSQKRIVGMAIAAVAIIGILVGIVLNQGSIPRRDDSQIAEIKQQVELTRTALAATENLEAKNADQAWQQLYGLAPGDTSVLRNRALNRLLWVDELTETANNSSLEDADRKQARTQLPDAIAGARGAIDQFDKATKEDSLVLWMQSRVNLREASLLPSAMTKSIRRDVYQTLVDAVTATSQASASQASASQGSASQGSGSLESTALESTALASAGDELDARGSVAIDRSAILGGTLLSVIEQMEDPIDGLPAQTLQSAATAMGSLSRTHADNLYFALRAAKLQIQAKQDAATEAIGRIEELTQAIEPSVASETRKVGVTPAELAAQIRSAVESGDFEIADGRMLLWFNVLNGSEIVKTDRRRASPHPLDLMSFDSLRTLSAKLVDGDPIEKSSASWRFDRREIADVSNVGLIRSFDFDLDLDPDLICIDETGVLTVLRNDGEASFDRGGTSGLGFVPSGILFADLFVVDGSSPGKLRRSGASVSGRHDTFMTLVAFGTDGVRLISVDGRSETDNDGRVSVVSAKTGLEDVKNVTAAIATDLEADGDLDLVFATEDSGIRMFVNRGNRTFFELAGLTDSGGKGPIVSLAMGDLDRDLDMDLLAVHRSGAISQIENLLHLQFRIRSIDGLPPIPGADTITIEDVDGNVSWDLIVAGSQSATVVFSQTADAGAWSVERIEQLEGSFRQAEVVDLDNDSWFELVSEDQIALLGSWGIAETVNNVEVSGAKAFADFNNDGLVDMASAGDDTASVLINQSVDAESGKSGHYVNVRFRGIDDNVSGRVNHFAIGSVLETRFGPHYRARVIRSPMTHFGIDGFDSASSVRAILPNGLTQTIRDPASDSLVEEEQTLKGSCPYLYAWDGDEFQFVTDCLWAAPLGLQVAAGKVAQDRPWEYLKIDGTNIRPRDGRYEFRMTEELWEVAYFDHVAVTAVDHPADVDVWTNEKVGPPDLADPKVFSFGRQSVSTVTSASNTSGRDVSAQLRKIDRDFVQGFDRRIRQGLCPPHWIDVEFPSITPLGDNRLHLILTGWILPTDTSLNIQIDQNPDLPAIEFPSVWVPTVNGGDGGGEWKKVIDFIGFPGGKTKTIVVDVTDVYRPDDLRFRVRTSAQIYWDAAQLATTDTSAEVERYPLELLEAEVGFHGFSRRIKTGPRQPEVYDYSNASLASRWPPLKGFLSASGQCLDLLTQWDDQMVVISSGDEIRMSFSCPPEDPPEGWVRDFIFHSVGWDKDADLNTLAGQTIGPLPSRGMEKYPPSRLGSQKQQELVDLNRHHRSREQAFRKFWYRSADPPPMAAGQ